MKTNTLAPLALAFIAALFLQTGAASAQAAGTKIAVANPARIFTELQETKDLKATMEAKNGALQKEEFTRRQRIKDLQDKRNGLKPDSAAYQEANRDLLNATIEFEVWARTAQANVQSEQKLQMMTLFVKITNAVQEVAANRGIDLVLAEQRPEFPENIDSLNVDQLRALINSRNVLFTTPQVDISNDVIAVMDAKYKAGK